MIISGIQKAEVINKILTQENNYDFVYENFALCRMLFIVH